MTENATQAIRLLKDATPEVPDDAGLRISSVDPAAEPGSLQIAFATEPDDADAVVDAGGERVFLEPTAAALLDDKVLDARIEEDRVDFALAQQPGLDGRPAD